MSACHDPGVYEVFVFHSVIVHGRRTHCRKCVDRVYSRSRSTKMNDIDRHVTSEWPKHLPILNAIFMEWRKDCKCQLAPSKSVAANDCRGAKLKINFSIFFALVYPKNQRSFPFMRQHALISIHSRHRIIISYLSFDSSSYRLPCADPRWRDI